MYKKYKFDIVEYIFYWTTLIVYATYVQLNRNYNHLIFIMTIFLNVVNLGLSIYRLL